MHEVRCPITGTHNGVSTLSLHGERHDAIGEATERDNRGVIQFTLPPRQQTEKAANCVKESMASSVKVILLRMTIRGTAGIQQILSKHTAYCCSKAAETLHEMFHS